jgi:isopentenyl-diphosphate Delta-isomerase
MTEERTRKDDHLDLCIDAPVGFRNRTTLLEEVEIPHDALPELSVEDVDLRTTLLGKALRAPLMISGMSGGADRATALNRDLATAAESLGIAFGFGSQRSMLRGDVRGFNVRDVAPSALLVGNIGATQVVQSSTTDLREIVLRSGVDALAVHLNPAMECIQPGGDRDFRGCLDGIRRLVEELGVPVMVKETGNGLSENVGRRLREAGVHTVDTGGAGGTSWVGVETLRATGDAVELGEMLWDWGIPTAASLVQLRGLGLDVIATGGIATGLDAARALALGARVAGVARAVLMAWSRGGKDQVQHDLEVVIAGIRLVHLLSGSRTPADLAQKQLVLGPRLSSWIPAGPRERLSHAGEPT